MRIPRLARIPALAAAFALSTLPSAPSAHAASVDIDQSYEVPNKVGGGFVCVNDRCVALEGVENLTLRVQASGVVADKTRIGRTGHNCARLDHALHLVMDSTGQGVVSISYTSVEPYGEERTSHTHTIPLDGAVTDPDPTTIKACVR